MTDIARLQAWNQSHYDGEWEHGYGVSIDTLDNPGWSVRVNLQGTTLLDKPFALVERGMDPDETDWIRCVVEKQQFYGVGGASNLSEILKTFLDWAEA